MRTVRRCMYSLVAALVLLAMPAPSPAQIGVGISIRVAPPALRVYDQPLCPGPGYIWTPGYWAYGAADYYWVPGAWILAPTPGYLWTPGYWGFGGGLYVWHAGYWGPHVGFYGGVHYGFGYPGVGFAGGRWDHGVFFYNRSVSHVNVNIIHNTYNERVVVRNTSRVSFNGEGGVNARPTREEEAAAHEHHIEATHAQVQHRENVQRRGNTFHPPAHNQPNRANRPESRPHEQARPESRPHEQARPAHENNSRADQGHPAKESREPKGDEKRGHDGGHR